MTILGAAPLACPIDGLPLVLDGARCRCAGGHSYDRAREGYWNLLVVQHKASRDPGDSREMVAARRRFLDAGHFAPVADAVFQAVRTVMASAGETPQRPFTIVDAGCGEGFTLDRLADLASKSSDSGTLALAGIDISKWAVKAAARRKAPVTWLVANNSRPPFPPGSVDVVLCLFGFPVWEGFSRIQPVGAHVLMVDPGPDHLIELREVIYPLVRRTPPPPLDAAEAAGYHLVREQALQFPVALSGAGAIQDLVAMTPHAHRLSQPGREALSALHGLTVTVDVAIRTLVRRPG